MNHRQLELVRTSYERIRRVRPLFADLFNRRLLLIAPVLDRLLPADPGRRDDAFIEVVEQIVSGLDRLDTLLPALVAQARAWKQRGVEPADYEVAGMALLWTVELVLAGSPGAIAAWRETFELLAGVMKRAAFEPDLPAPPSLRPHTPTPPYLWGVRPPPPRSEGTPRSYRLTPVSERTPRSQRMVPVSQRTPRSQRVVPVSERAPSRSQRPPVSEHTPGARDTLPSM